jgi:hypothetical protein
MKAIFCIILFIGSVYPQSGLFKNTSVMVGMNQSFYGKDWKDFVDSDEFGFLTQNPFRKMNFNLINEFEYGVLGGLKYLTYGYDIEINGTGAGGYTFDEEYIFEATFVKLFVTYPMGSGLYFGVEGGYFIEGKRKWKANNSSYINEDIMTETYDREFWVDGAGFNDYDYGLVGQYYYNIKDNLLATVEAYYCLSEFSEGNRILFYNINTLYRSVAFIRHSFNYVNLGLTIKLGKK